MKILLLSQWYLPEPVKYVSDLAESWQAQGHKVTVLTGFPNYPTGKLSPGYKIKLWQREAINGVPIIRVPLYPDHSTSLIQRLVNFGSFAACATLLGPWLVPRVDVIHVIHPPLTIGIPARVLGCLFRRPFTYEIQDLWPEVLRATGVLKNRWALGVMGWYAKRVYRAAKAIRVISPGFRRNLIGKGVSGDKIHVISNWVDTDLYRPVEPDLELARTLGLADRFNVMFAGAIGLSQGLEAVLDAAALLADLPEMQFVLVGDGADLARLTAVARQRNLSNVKFLGRHPAAQMPSLYALADVLLVHLRADPLFRITVPHKIFAYMASAKPVLAAVEGDAADIVRSAKAGLTCRPCDPQALAERVRQFYAMSLSERQTMAESGYRLVRESFSRELLVSKATEMLEAVARPQRGRPPQPDCFPPTTRHSSPRPCLPDHLWRNWGQSPGTTAGNEHEDRHYHAGGSLRYSAERGEDPGSRRRRGGADGHDRREGRADEPQELLRQGVRPGPGRPPRLAAHADEMPRRSGRPVGSSIAGEEAKHSGGGAEASDPLLADRRPKRGRVFEKAARLAGRPGRLALGSMCLRSRAVGRAYPWVHQSSLQLAATFCGAVAEFLGSLPWGNRYRRHGSLHGQQD
jgi:colanic acid biosynthesis glycosyl transferase WcaI